MDNSFIGQTFGRLTIIENKKLIKSIAFVKCICKCGKLITVQLSHLRSGHTKSCGCLRYDIKNLTGQRFGKLIVLSRGNNKGEGSAWNCLCDCSNKCLIRGSCLRKTNRSTKSCGCLRLERMKEKRLSHNYSQLARNRLLRSYKKSAVKRGLSWWLTDDDFDELTQANCWYCARPPSNICNEYKSHYIYNGIDRWDNYYGYSLWNVVTCCSICNYAKGTSSATEFLSMCKEVSKQHEKFLL